MWNLFGRSETETVFSLNLPVIPFHYHFTAASYFFMYHLWNGQRVR